MKLSTKMYGSLGGLLAVGLVMTAATFYIQRTLANHLDIAVQQTTKKLDLVNAMRARAWEAEANKRGAYLAATLGNAALSSEFSGKWEKALNRLREQIHEVEPLLVTAEGKAALGDMRTTADQYEPLVRQFLDLVQHGRAQEVGPLVSRIIPLVDKFDKTGQSLVVQQRAFLETSKAAAQSAVKVGSLVSVLLLLLLAGAGMFAGLVVRSAVRSMGQAVEELTLGARQVASAAIQISSSSQSLSQAASEQAASLEETSASSHEINATTASNAAGSLDAAKRATAASERVDQASSHLRDMVTSMDEIVKSSSEISKIIRVIDGIAFQTNILALNAAVEAARAGEAGMGFAVVADEVRTLAQRSAQAARDTSDLIEGAIRCTEDGKTKLGNVTQAISGVTEDAGQVRILAEQVHSSSAEQQRGMGQISIAIQQMERVTQQVAANAEETASAGEELAAQASQVNETVSRLAALVYGGAEVRQ